MGGAGWDGLRTSQLVEMLVQGLDWNPRFQWSVNRIVLVYGPQHPEYIGYRV